MKFCTLFSGSSGNCAYVEYDGTRLLVDAGGNMTAIKRGLEKLGVSLGQIDAILLTHGHTDHTAALRVVSGRFGMPILGTYGTLERVLETCGDILPDRLTMIDEHGTYTIGKIEVTVFKTPHDADGSVGYSLCADSRLTIATDMGYVTDETYELMKKSDFVIIEANYDEDMLEQGPYYEALKRRIRGKRGHLSNGDCAETVCRLTKDGVKHFMLAHLSENNNTPQTAMEQTLEALMKMGVRPGEVTVDIAPRHEVGRLYTI